LLFSLVRHDIGIGPITKHPAKPHNSVAIAGAAGAAGNRALPDRAMRIS
jgi:hypothetical protein